jgi:nitroreductase
MDVAEAVGKRMSVRAFKPDPVPGDTVRRLLELSAQAPSGGNLQPWRVYALAGEPLAEFKALITTSPMEEPEYDVYPPSLWDPFRTRRFVCGEDLYASIGIARDDRPARFRQLARNGHFFGAGGTVLLPRPPARSAAVVGPRYVRADLHAAGGRRRPGHLPPGVLGALSEDRRPLR